jgi:hypothetical protein
MEFFPMMGLNDKPQNPLFYSFNLNGLAQQDHLLRKMERLRLLGLQGAQGEFLLTATAQNLGRMASYLWTGPPGVPEWPESDPENQPRQQNPAPAGVQATL